MVSANNNSTTRPATSPVAAYPVRLLRPLLMHAMHGNHANRTAPGGSIVNVMESKTYAPGEVTLTATVTMDGVNYARDLKPDRSQFQPLT